MEKYLKNKKINAKAFRSGGEIETHEIFLDSFLQKKEKNLEISERKFEVPFSKKSLFNLYIFLLILILLFSARTFQLQIIHGKDFTIQAQENKLRYYQIKAIRGVIYDKNMKQLVFNQQSFDLICQKNELPIDESKLEKVLKNVSEIIEIDVENLKKEIEENQDWEILISENLDQQRLIQLETKIASKEILGFQIKNDIKRNYVDGSSFAHLIGYVGKGSKIGEAGLEKSYDGILKEEPGFIEIEKDVHGNKISQKIVSFPEPGKNLVLSLDFNLQKKIEESLKKSLENVRAKKGAGVALNPKTGEVLALVSLPSFDNNKLSQGISLEDWQKLKTNPLDPLFNKAISGIGYPMGSTIKPLIGIAALEENIINKNTTINCLGKISVQDKWDPEIFHDFLDWKIHEKTDIYKAIAESCNVFFYIVGGGYKDFRGLGPTKIKSWLETFGWSKKTGIDLPEEGKGFLPTPEWKKEELKEIWYDGDTYHLSIGQGYISATPLQVAASFVPIANKGKFLKPKIAKEIIDTEKNLIEKIEPEILKEDFIKEKNLEIIRQGMREAVTYGSAVNWLNSLPVKAAAKTGTAQTGKKDKIDKKDYLDSWITVFAPFDEPEIVLTLMVEDVKEGQVAVLPVAKEVLEWYFKDSEAESH